MNEGQAKRFMAKVEKTDSCWLWTASRKPNGYGQFGLDAEQRSRYAHRLSYEYFVGPIPNGLEVDHLCFVRHCVNPDHMQLVSHAENCLRGDGLAARNARKTHCPQGHEYARHALIQKDGSRKCRLCHARRERARRAKRRAWSL